MSKLITPEFRVSYPNVFKPRYNDLAKKEQYSVEALFSKDTDLTQLKKAVQDAIIEKWGETAKIAKSPDGMYSLSVDGKVLTKKVNGKDVPAEFRIPFKDQGDKEKDGILPEPLVKGALFISLKSDQKPGVVDQNVQAIINESEFYAGCFAKASVNAKAYDNAGNRGVAIYLNNIQKTKEGESLGGKPRPQDDFAAIADANETDSGDGLFN